MPKLIADTSALVSLGIVSGSEVEPLALCLSTFDVSIPEEVVAELEDVGSYEDEHGQAASSVLDRLNAVCVESVELDAEFPLDDGENAAVTLANRTSAAFLLCDEFNRLGLIHASLADTRLVTTPTLLSVLVRNNHLQSAEALAYLEQISSARSWEQNSYVQRARSLLK